MTNLTARGPLDLWNCTDILKSFYGLPRNEEFVIATFKNIPKRFAERRRRLLEASAYFHYDDSTTTSAYTATLQELGHRAEMLNEYRPNYGARERFGEVKATGTGLLLG
eukprot:457591-Prorocentrum_minimum.AAC.2